ncbi:MAG TPA: hypothetical protein VFQ38_09855 [Longimicrobiales bacterium]|nr:hypothetical protein [Longimicrobiales bacterium]
MARYDRIAPIPAPARGTAFPGWLALRDLEENERDADLARHVRLRFLALRPLRRLLAAGLAAVPQPSFERQVESVREELGQLSPRDPERAQLARFLHSARGRSPAVLAEACLDMGEAVEEAGHRYGAEEFYSTAFELSDAMGLAAARAAALRRLGTLYHRLSRPTDARRALGEAAQAALAAGERGEWAQAAVAAAALARTEGDAAGARAMLDEVARRGRAWGDPAVSALGLGALSALELAEGAPDRAVEHAWSALECAPTAPMRVAALGRLGAALRALGLHPAALRAFELALTESGDEAERWRTEIELAVTSAEAANVSQFVAGRRRLLREAKAEPPPRRTLALLHLRLGQGCLLAGMPDFARDHIREGINLGRILGDAELLRQLEDLLELLERPGAADIPFAALRKAPAERTLRIAGEIQASRQPVAAHS